MPEKINSVESIEHQIIFRIAFNRMPRRFSLGQPAKHKYRPVRYSHVIVGPGDSLLLTADPWSYLQAHLRKRLKTSRGKNARNLDRAIYFAQLAEDFYYSGAAADLPTNGVLLYYGMLNLAKCFMSASKVELESSFEHHGLSVPLDEDLHVQVSGTGSNEGFVHIFSEFARLMNTPVLGKESFHVTDIACQIPEIHEIGHALGHLKSAKRKFLPVEVHFLVNDNYNRLFTELRYAKRHESTLPTHKLYRDKIAEYFYEPFERDGWIVLRSKRRKSLSNSNWDRIYKNILKEYQDFRICSILTRQGYRYYFDLEPPEYHHLCYTLMIMFYAGAIARYRPSVLENVMSGDLRPLITEAMALCPRQFLYQIVSLTTGTLCVVPMAEV